MCTQCLVYPYYFGEVIPGWFLIRARKDDYKDNPLVMKAGDFGLVVVNEPSVVWSTLPKIIPNDDSSDEELDKFYAEVDEFEERITHMGIDGIVSLVNSCRKVGFNENNNKYFAEWFYDYIAKYISSCTIEEDSYELVKDNPIRLFEPLGICK